MFRNPPSIHLAIPKKHHKILSVVATGMLMFGTSLLGLSLGSDHWRESHHNKTLTIQGLVHECDKSANVIKCIAITRSTFASGLLGHLEIIYGLLIESAVLGALCHLASVIASFHRRAILVTAVVATEITAATAGSMAMVCFSVKFLERPWKAGWSYALAWLGSLTLYLAAIVHFILQDVKFLGKKFCM